MDDRYRHAARFALLWAVALLWSCTNAGELLEPQPPKTPESPTLPQVYSSGARLQAVYYDAEGITAFRFFNDSRFGEWCTVEETPFGMRCLPAHNTRPFYTDPQCTDAALSHPRPQRARLARVVNIGGADEVFLLGERLEEPPAYTFSGGECVRRTVQDDNAYFRIGDPVPLTAFVEFFSETRSLNDTLETTFYLGEDGSFFQGYTIDRLTGQQCIASNQRDYDGRCIPSGIFQTRSPDALELTDASCQAQITTNQLSQISMTSPPFYLYLIESGGPCQRPISSGLFLATRSVQREAVYYRTEGQCAPLDSHPAPPRTQDFVELTEVFADQLPALSRTSFGTGRVALNLPTTPDQQVAAGTYEIPTGLRIPGSFGPGFFDQQLSTACIPTMISAQMRCLPVGLNLQKSDDRYRLSASPDCSTPLVSAYLSQSQIPEYVLINPANVWDNETETPAALEVYSLGRPVQPESIYMLQPDSNGSQQCVPSPRSECEPPFYEVGERLDPEVFPKIEVRNEALR